MESSRPTRKQKVRSAAAITPEPLLNVSGHEKMVNCIAWLANDRIVTGSDDKTVRIWNLTDGTQEGASMVHEDSVDGVMITKDRRIVSRSGRPKHLMIWNADTQELESGSWSSENYGPAKHITFSAGGEFLASWHEEWIVFWKMVNIQIRVRSYFSYECIGGSKHPSTARLSPDGKRFAAYDQTLVVLDVESGQTIFNVAPGYWIGFIRWSADGARLFCAHAAGGLARWFDSSTGETIGEKWTDGLSYMNDFSLSPDGKQLACGGPGTLRFWDVESRKLVGEEHHLGLFSVHAIVFSPSGEFIACRTFGTHILAWRVPWWDNDDRKALNPLLDLSAVVSPGSPSDIPREPDPGFLDISAPRQPLPSRGRSGENPSDDPPGRVQHSLLSWWRRIPRFVLSRSHPIRMGLAESRTYVASTDTVPSSPRSLAQPVPSAPRFVVVVEHSSGESSDEDTSNTASSDLEVNRTGCCGLFSRGRPIPTTAPERQDPPPQLSAPTTHPRNSTNTAMSLSTRSAAQDILELSAVVR